MHVTGQAKPLPWRINMPIIANPPSCGSTGFFLHYTLKAIGKTCHTLLPHDTTPHKEPQRRNTKIPTVLIEPINTINIYVHTMIGVYEAFGKICWIYKVECLSWYFPICLLFILSTINVHSPRVCISIAVLYDYMSYMAPDLGTKRPSVSDGLMNVWTPDPRSLSRVYWSIVSSLTYLYARSESGAARWRRNH